MSVEEPQGFEETWTTKPLPVVANEPTSNVKILMFSGIAAVAVLAFCFLIAFIALADDREREAILAEKDKEWSELVATTDSDDAIDEKMLYLTFYGDAKNIESYPTIEFYEAENNGSGTVSIVTECFGLDSNYAVLANGDVAVKGITIPDWISEKDSDCLKSGDENWILDLAVVRFSEDGSSINLFSEGDVSIGTLEANDIELLKREIESSDLGVQPLLNR